MKEERLTAETIIATIRPLPGPLAILVVPKDTADIVNGKTMPRMSVRPVLNVERLDISTMSAEVTLPTI